SPELPAEDDVLLHLRPHLVHVAAILGKGAIVVAVLAAIEFTFEIVITGRAIVIAIGLAAVTDYLLHPPLLGFRRDVNRLVAVLPRVIDTGGDMVALRLQHLGQVETERRLIAAHDEQVRIAVRMNSQQRADTLGILVVQVEAALTANLIVDPGLLHFEAGCINQQIDRVLFTLENRTARGDLGDTLAVRIDQMNVGPIEGGQIIVVETGPLAHEHVPRLERFCGRLVLDDLFDPPMDAHHVFDIGVFLTADFFFGRQRRSPNLLLFGQLRLHPRQRAPLRLPSRLQFLRPLRIGLPIVLEINRRRSALENVELLRGLAEPRDRLHRGRAGPDNADDLVSELFQIRPGVIVVPSRSMERMALEGLHPLDLRKLRFRQRPVGADDEARAQMVAAVGADMPHLLGLVPGGRGYRGLKDRQFVQIVTACDKLTVREDLRRLRIVARRHVAGLVEQWQIVVSNDIARRPGVTVPVPGTADVGAALNDTDTLDANLAQSRGGKQSRESAADKQHFDRVVDRLARLDRRRVRIDLEPRQFAGQLRRVLFGALGPIAQAQVALLGEFLLDAFVILLRAIAPHVERVEGPDWGRRTLLLHDGLPFLEFEREFSIRRAKTSSLAGYRQKAPFGPR